MKLWSKLLPGRWQKPVSSRSAGAGLWPALSTPLVRHPAGYLDPSPAERGAAQTGVDLPTRKMPPGKERSHRAIRTRSPPTNTDLCSKMSSPETAQVPCRMGCPALALEPGRESVYLEQWWQYQSHSTKFPGFSLPTY